MGYEHPRYPQWTFRVLLAVVALAALWWAYEWIAS